MSNSSATSKIPSSSSAAGGQRNRYNDGDTDTDINIDTTVSDSTGLSTVSPSADLKIRQSQHEENSNSTNDRGVEEIKFKSGPADEGAGRQVHKSKWRPADILNWGLTNSTRLIGWNDDEFHDLIEEHRRRRSDDNSIPNAEETGFGLMNILINSIKEAVYKKTDFDDLKSDLKRLEGKDVDLRGQKQKSFNDNVRGVSPGSISTASTASADASTRTQNHTGPSSIDIIGTQINVREMKAYKNLLSSVKYQRDAYIMGKDHADLRKTEREEEQRQLESKQSRSDNNIDIFNEEESDDGSSNDDYDNESNEGFVHSPGSVTYNNFLLKNPTVADSSIGKHQLTHLCSWFIPSPTMHNAILPTALWTISPPSPNMPEGGPLRRIINRSFCALIPLSQNLLDQTMKSSMLYVLSDDAMRDSVKGSSRNYLGGNVLGVQQNNAGKFVTTKTVQIY